MIAGAVGLIFVLLMLLSAGSRAGVVIGLLIFVASLLLLTARSRAGIGALVAVFVGVALYTMGVWARFESENTAGLDDLRLEFLQTSWEGIKQNWLLGIGYGNFEKAYQIYEKPEQIFQYFVNHAHNEYVQLVFEGGILAAGLIMLYLIVIHVQIWRNGTDGFRKVAYLSILFLLLHSLIDYPLRTYALAMAFAFFNAVLFYTGTFLPKARTEPVEIVESE
nr:O-antigen ligase family protein [Oryzicola mucosus]